MSLKGKNELSGLRQWLALTIATLHGAFSLGCDETLAIRKKAAKLARSWTAHPIRLPETSSQLCAEIGWQVKHRWHAQ
jgi:hypothetical protein